MPNTTAETQTDVQSQNTGIFRYLPQNQAVIDIHTGGEDHIDIHHKNEKEQSKALGFNLSKTWVHNKFVLVDGKKMSKSLGNVYLVTGKQEKTSFYSFENPPVNQFSPEFKQQIIKKYKELKIYDLFASTAFIKNQDLKKEDLNSTNSKITDALQKTTTSANSKGDANSEDIFWNNFSFDPLSYRLMMFEHHYTQQMDFTWEKLWQSQMRLWGMRKEKAKVHSYFLQQNPQNLDADLFESKKHVWLKLIANNFNFPEFLDLYQKTILDLSNSINKAEFSNTDYLLLLRFDEDLLELKLWGLEISETDKIWEMGKQRNEVKNAKDYQKADAMRTEIQKLGWQIDDYAWGWGIWRRGC